MKINEKMKKAVSALLCLCMLAQNAPVAAFAAQEDCTHHTEHTQECGYAEAVEEVLCACAETDENGALVHTEGCGYAAAVEGQPCTYHCEICLGNDDEKEEKQETPAPSEPETTEATEATETTEATEATETTEAAQPIELHTTVTRTMEPDAAGLDNDEAFAAYVERLFYGDSGAAAFAPLVGDRLTGANKKVYNSLKSQITAVAAGTQASTVFSVSTEEMGITVTVTEEDLEGRPIYVIQDGVASFTAEAENVLIEKFFAQVNVQLIQNALNSDCPYELYWLDRSVNSDLSFSMATAQDAEENVYGLITELMVILYVSRDYQGESTITVDSRKPTVAAQAAATARGIASAQAGKTDYEKLVAYKDYICNAVSYNFDAVKPDYERGYGDPYQMIYVFDGDPNTNVVCEGYSKALQYLCDQSGVRCISVGGPFGDESENGLHMWNIVTLEGKNYLADLTNSEEGMVGQKGELFLAGSAIGSVEEGYLFSTAEGNMGYIYDELTRSTWETADLTLAAENYPVPETPAEPENHTLVYTVSGSTITASCSTSCGCSGTASVSAAGKTYDGNAVTATVSKTGILAGETIGITYYRDGEVLNESAIHAGTYTASITVGGATASVDFTITPATPVIIWDDHTVTYTGAPADLPALTITLVNGETFRGNITCSYDGGKPGVPTDAGTYALTASVAAAGNYTAASKTIQLTITKAASALTRVPEARTLTFNGQNQALITAGTATGGTVKYRLSRNDSFSTAIPTGKNAGTYTVYYMVEGDANHNDTAESTVEVTIAKAVAAKKEIPVQKHFRTYAVSNSLDLSGFLPKDSGETAYTLGNVAGDFFEAGTAVTNGVLNYATNVAGTNTTGSIQVDVVMKNYANVTLTVNVERVELTEKTRQQVAKNDLTDVPAGLAGIAGLNTAEAIKAEQNRVLTRLLGEDPKANVIHYDMKLQFSPDGENSWVDAAYADFPAEGVSVTLPYPIGTGKNTHNFAVSHMFTAGSVAGTVETPKVTKTDSGIQFTLTGMSPVSVGWSAIRFDVAVASASYGKVAVSHANAPTGTQVTIKVTPNSGYRMSTLTVLDDAGNSCILGAVNDDTYIFTMPAAKVTVKATFVRNSSSAADTTNPKTGDDFHILFWGGMMMTAMLGIALLLDNRKKFFRK